MKKERLTFQRESIDKLLSEGAEDLFIQNWEQIALDRDKVLFVPDWDVYRKLEKKKQMVICTIRRGGRLVGYASFWLVTPARYSTTLHAQNDVIYVDPSERGFAGVVLVRKAEKVLRALGVKKLSYHTKLHVPLGHATKAGTVGRFLELMGYRHDEEVRTKLL